MARAEPHIVRTDGRIALATSSTCTRSGFSSSNSVLRGMWWTRSGSLLAKAPVASIDGHHETVARIKVGAARDHPHGGHSDAHS